MNWGLVDVQCFRCTTQCFTTFKDYTPFIVVIKYRLCSLSYMIYPHSLFIHSSLCLPFPAPVWSLPLPPALLPTSLFLCPWVCFCLAMVHQLSSVGPVMSDSLWPLGCSTPGLPVHHQLPELAQTHVHWVGDAIQPSHPVSPPSPPAFNLSQRQGLFQWVSSSHQVARILEFQLQHQSVQRIPRTDFL